MEQDFILSIITRNTGVHRFLDIANFNNWEELINKALNKYGVFNKDEPSAIYIPGLKKIVPSQNLQLLSQYYKYKIANAIVEHLGTSSETEKAILNSFRFGDKSKDVKELLQKLRDDISGFESQVSIQEIYRPKIKFLGLCSINTNLEMDTNIKWFCNLYINAINFDYNSALILNDYISARIGGAICFNVIFDSTIGYPANTNQNGRLVQNVHDYQLVRLLEYKFS